MALIKATDYLALSEEERKKISEFPAPSRTPDLGDLGDALEEKGSFILPPRLRRRVASATRLANETAADIEERLAKSNKSK